jgi:hypothetical protein
VVFELNNLFRQLVFSDSGSISPAKKLGEIILTNQSGNTFGEQQDFHECIDNCMDMLDCAFKVFGGQDGSNETHCEILKRFYILISLFFGKVRQTVKVLGEQRKIQKTLINIEDFHELIVNVETDLYLALDGYFTCQPVTYN